MGHNLIKYILYIYIETRNNYKLISNKTTYSIACTKHIKSECTLLLIVIL